MASGVGAAGLLALYQFATFGWEVVKAFRTGVMRTLNGYRSAPIDRREYPVQFWFEVLWGIFLSCLMLVVGILALQETQTLPPGHPVQTVTDYLASKGNPL